MLYLFIYISTVDGFSKKHSYYNSKFMYILKIVPLKQKQQFMHMKIRTVL